MYHGYEFVVETHNTLRHRLACPDLHQLHIPVGIQWQIQDFPYGEEGGGANPKGGEENLLFRPNFPKNCRKMKTTWTGGGSGFKTETTFQLVRCSARRFSRNIINLIKLVYVEMVRDSDNRAFHN